MGNLFEPNIWASSNRLLNELHQGDSLLSRSRSDVSWMSTSGDPVELKEIVSGSNNIFTNIKSNGTPMKMLIAQEMSEEVVSRRDPSNLVAKLMDIDVLPHREPGSTTQRSHSRVHPRSNLDIPMNYPEQQNGSFPYMNPNECNGRYEEAVNDRKMNLVRQKFNEAKCLSIDEKLRQSNRFHDAIDVLSSNKDLLLKYLQEPNVIYSQQIRGLHSIQPPPETKRITVLRSSKVADSSDFAGASTLGSMLIGLVVLTHLHRLHVAKRRQNRYVQKLVFDCVNEVLVDTSGYESDSRQRAFGTYKCILDEEWTQMKVWFSGEDKCTSRNKEVVVERVVNKEVLVKGWNRNFGLETDSLGKEIGGELLDELVQETVVELIDW
ncbi:hypothetical protein OROGR_025114 [Orobanche gracilis]